MDNLSTTRRSDKVAKAASALALAAETYANALTDEVGHIVAADQIEALTRQAKRDDDVLDRIEACERNLSAEIAAVRAELQSGIKQMHARFDPVDQRQAVKEVMLHDVIEQVAQVRAIVAQLDAESMTPHEAIQAMGRVIAQVVTA